MIADKSEGYIMIASITFFFLKIAGVTFDHLVGISHSSTSKEHEAKLDLHCCGAVNFTAKPEET